MRTRIFLIVSLAAVLVGPSALAAGSRAWYTGGEFDKAKEQAKLLGKPIVILYQEDASTCPKHNTQRRKWRKLSTLRQFVCVQLDTSDKDEIASVRQADKKNKQGKYIPMLFFTTPDGKFLDVIPYKASKTTTNKTIAAVRKKFGRVLPRAKAIMLWKKLSKARKLWKEEDYAAALACYRTVAIARKINPNLPIVKELKADEKAISEHAAPILKEAKTLHDDGETAKAVAMLQNVQQTYKGLEPAKGAKDLLGEIQGTSKKPTPPTNE